MFSSGQFLSAAPFRAQLFLFVALAVAPRANSVESPGDLISEHQFHHEDILGTSLDLIILSGNPAVAGEAEQAVLAEIERLRQILSTYDPASELSRFNASQGPMLCSQELIEVLGAYDEWAARSKGAYSGQLGDLIQTWRAAEQRGRLPDPESLAAAVAALRQAAWSINTCERSATRLVAHRLNVDSLGKGYVIGKALEAARANGPAVRGLLINLGGDIRAWGRSGARGAQTWRLGVADPRRHEDNAPPLTQVVLADQAISTSAAYERGYDFNGQHYSHILDPRNGYPAAGAASATVVAGDNVTANALATMLCVLEPAEGLKLVRDTGGAECLIVSADGTQWRSGGFAALEVRADDPAPPAQPRLWPKDFQVKLSFTLKSPPPGTQKVKRPYVAVWIEDAQGKPVRTVTFWGNKEKYYKDLPGWWKFAREDRDFVRAVTRATRPAGRHQVVWDGNDDAGNPLPFGTYTVVLEVAREHGTHAQKSAKIICGREAAKAVLPDGSEFDAAEVTYGPRTAQP